MKIKSIDQIHDSKLNYFKKLQLKLKNPSKLTEKEIQDIENRKEENEYWLNSFPHYYEYKNILENDKVQTLDFNNASAITAQDNSEKANALKKYLSTLEEYRDKIVDYADLYTTEYTVCRDCSSIEIVERSSRLICNECGLDLGLDFSKPVLGYKDLQEMNFKSQYFYKRINHFQECLNQLQGKEKITIPDKIYTVIQEECKKQRIAVMDLEPGKIKFILKKNRLTKYSENSQLILFNLTGKVSITLSGSLEEKLKDMFNQIQEPFDRYKGDRKNFLNYNYCFYKFFEILDLYQYLSYFPLLKDRQKLADHDKIWNKICTELGWKFIPCY